MKKIVLLVAFGIVNDLYAQELGKEFYSEKDEVTNEANSYYYKVGKLQEPTGKTFVDTVKSYFTASNKPRSVEIHGSYGRLKSEYVEYYEYGGLKEKGFYNDGRKVKYYEGFYPNGKQQYTFDFPQGTEDYSWKPNTDSYNFQIVNYWDSLGNQLVKDGEGQCTCYVELMKEYYREEGKVSKGLRESEWRGYKDGVLAYKEQYINGVLQRGTSFKDGDTFQYTQHEEAAEYPKGLENLYKFLAKTVVYPKDARWNGIQGTVFVSFVVEKTGSLEQIMIIKDPDPILGKEAIRVMQQSKKWVPAKFKGTPVKSRYVLPIKFKL